MPEKMQRESESGDLRARTSCCTCVIFAICLPGPVCRALLFTSALETLPASASLCNVR